MSCQVILKTFLLLLATACLTPAVARAADAARKPNIVVIVADDMGYADVGFHGAKDIPTPHLDALAKGGVICKSGYVSGPYCSPTRAGFLTGRYQTRFGHEFNPGGGGENLGLPLSEKTVADYLKGAGYKTGLVGKWHLGGGARFQPQQRGFDEFFGFLGGAHGYFSEKGGAPILRGTTVVEEREYLTDAFAREAVAFIDRHQSEPFFLYLAFNAVHTPMHANDARLERFKSIEDKTRRTYAAMLSAMDDGIGKVRDKLQSAGLEENTLVFFFSDNGGPTMPGTTVNGSSNAPLRGSKRTTLEGGVRVPFVVSWKGKLPAGKTYEPPVIQLDILPTALAAAGANAPAGAKFDGLNLLPYLAGEKAEPPHETLYWRFGEQMAIRHGNWKLVKYDAAVDGAARTGKKKAAVESAAAKLYELSVDVGEAKDKATENPAKVAELQALWEKWNAEQAKPLWGGKGE